MAMMDNLIQEFERGQFVVIVFLDFSKAFDTVNHDILFEKLYHYFIRDPTLLWFKGYTEQKNKHTPISTGNLIIVKNAQRNCLVWVKSAICRESSFAKQDFIVALWRSGLLRAAMVVTNHVPYALLGISVT